MTARYARRVVLMSNDGRLIETGDPKTLMEDEDSSLYALIHKVKDLRGPSVAVAVPVAVAFMEALSYCGSDGMVFEGTLVNEQTIDFYVSGWRR